MNVQVSKIDGKIRVGRKKLFHLLGKLDDGEWLVTIEKWEEKRTNLQNAFIHVCFDVYAKEMGYTLLEAKWILKKEFGINKLIKNKRTGKQDLLVRDTSDYNIKEAAVFIERLLNHFEYDCGIVIDPEVRKQYKLNEITGEMEEI